MECYDGLWLHVDVVGRVFAGYGTVAIQNFPLMTGFPPGVDVFAGSLDPRLEHLPPIVPSVA